MQVPDAHARTGYPSRQDPKDRPAYYGPASTVCLRCRVAITPGERGHQCVRPVTPERRTQIVAGIRQQLATVPGNQARADAETENKRAEART